MNERRQYLTFRLSGEPFGIDTRHVHRVVSYPVVTPMPDSATHRKGVMHLEGTPVPIVDLRSRAAMEIEHFTVIIVVKAGSHVMGLIVEAVAEVVGIETAQVRSAAHLGATIDAQYLFGVAQVGDRIVALLDVERIVSAFR